MINLQKNKSILIISCLTIFLLYSFMHIGSATAQKNNLREDVLKNGSKSDVFSNMKLELNRLLKENQQLIPQYEALKKDYSALQVKLNQLRGQINEYKQVPDSLAEDDKHPDFLQNEVLVLESRTAFLKTRLLDAQERKDLLELKLADEQFAQRELKIDLKFKEFQADQAKQKQKEGLAELENKRARLLDQEKEMIRLIKEVEHQAKVYPEKERRLRRENQELQKMLNELSNRYELKGQVIGHLEDKRLYKIKSKEGEFQAKKDAREKLQASVAHLQAQYDQLDRKIKTSLEQQQKHLALTKDVIDMDRENALLREKLEKLRGQVDLTE